MTEDQVVEVITPPCVMCGKTGTVKVLADDLKRYREGALVQVAFPEMPVDDREQFITGTHPACWDKMCPEDDE